MREHVEYGRTYLYEIVLGDPSEPHRREGLAPAACLEGGITTLLADDRRITHGTRRH